MFSQENGIHHSFFLLCDLGVGRQTEKGGVHGGGVYLFPCSAAFPVGRGVWMRGRNRNRQGKMEAIVAIRFQEATPEVAWNHRRGSARQASTSERHLSSSNQEPKSTHKAKNSHERHQRLSEKFESVVGSLPSKARGLRQITPESSPEHSTKSLSHSFLVVTFLSPIKGDDVVSLEVS